HTVRCAAPPGPQAPGTLGAIPAADCRATRCFLYLASYSVRHILCNTQYVFVKDYFLRNEKGRLAPAFLQNETQLLLGGNRVLRGFGDAELHDCLGFDLDGFAGLRIASNAGLAVGLYQAANTRNYEYAILLGLFDGCVGQVLEECCCGLIVRSHLLCQVTNE